MKIKAEILEDNGILLVTFYSSSIYDAVLKCMQEYSDQQLNEYKRKLKEAILDEIHPGNSINYNNGLDYVLGFIDTIQP